MTTQSSLLGVLAAGACLTLAPILSAQQAEPSKPKDAPAKSEPGKKPAAPPLCEDCEKPGDKKPAEHVHGDAPKPGEPRVPGRRDAEPKGEFRADAERMREALESRLRELRERLEDLRRGGKTDEANRVEAELREMGERMKRHAAEMRERFEAKRPEIAERMKRREGEPAPGARPGEAGELKQKLQHLMAAAENLHAAGMHEMAERVEQQAKGIRHELEERAAQQKPKEGEAKRPMPGAPAMPPMPQLQQELNELREAVRNLNRRLDEMSKDRR